MCEQMAKLICHASDLKCDDVSDCDMYAVENVYHMVMQCPIHEDDRINMYHWLYKRDPGLEYIFSQSPGRVLTWLLGGEIEDKSADYMYDFWHITGSAIHGMYKRIFANRSGVG